MLLWSLLNFMANHQLNPRTFHTQKMMHCLQIPLSISQHYFVPECNKSPDFTTVDI